jgi:hypothetical protein
VGNGRGLILKYYIGIRLEGLSKTISIAGRWCRHMNPVSPKHEAGVLTARPGSSVVWIKRSSLENNATSNIYIYIPMNISGGLDQEELFRK